MFIIKDEQFGVLADDMRIRFRMLAGSHLREIFPRSLNNLSDERLYDLIDKGIDQAASYNIIDRNDALQYLEFMICFGHDFDSSVSWAKKILTIRNLSGSEKTKRLIQKNPPVRESVL